jgi:acyl dehydratase
MSMELQFTKPVFIGDTITAEAEKIRRGMWWYRCEATVEAQTVASATIVCAPGGEAD